MGAAASKSGRVITGDPFPVDSNIAKDLDMLSFVAARILSTPDIYDITNLSNPEACGDYAVFLKKSIEKKLLPFVVDLSGIRTEVVYQNPRKAIGDVEVRRKICSSLANTMVRTIATVVACLASIQIYDQGRASALSTIPKLSSIQSGGDVNSVYDWLTARGYVPLVEGGKSGKPLDFTVPDSGFTKINYKLTLDRSEGNLTYAAISVENPKVSNMPSGYLRLQFLNAITLPVQDNTSITVLPVRIIDNAGIPWCAGILDENMFKSFSKANPVWITTIFEELFRSTQDKTGQSRLESRADITEANEVFQLFRREQQPKYIFQKLNDYFSQRYPTYLRSYQAPVYYPPAGIQQPYVTAAAVPFYQPPPQQLILPQQQQTTYYKQAPVAPTLYGRPGYTFDIPLNSSRSIITTLNEFRNLVATESSPAYARAHTLAGIETKDRTVQTGICRDPYWTQSTSKIYPWATLQFLSIKDWKKMGEDRTGDVNFEPEWTTFIQELTNIYNGTDYPLISAKTKFLNGMSITGINKIPICKNQNPVVKSKAVGDGLLSLQGIYARHVPKVWAILNDLIFVIKDPDTNQDVARLHPNVTSGSSSQAYVEGKAKEARTLLSTFYLDVERAYKSAIQSMEAV